MGVTSGSQSEKSGEIERFAEGRRMENDDVELGNGAGPKSAKGGF